MWCSLLVGATVSGAMFVYTRYYLEWNEKRSEGSIIEDPLFKIIPRVDQSTTVGCILTLATLVNSCEMYTRGTEAVIAFWAKFCVISYIKVVALYLLPLQPHPELIPLCDPILDMIMDGQVKRDLFFSGHTSYVVLCALSTTSFEYTVMYGIMSMCMGYALVSNRVHYSVDVFIAPFVVYVVDDLVNAFLASHR